MRDIKYGDTSEKAVIGDTVNLTHQKQEVVACSETGVPMVNIDADQLAPGDLRFIKALGLTISNPSTERPVAIGVDFKPETWGEVIARYFNGNGDESGLADEEPSEPIVDESTSDPYDDDDEEDDKDDDDDDSAFFGATGAFLGGLGSSGLGGFSGGSIGGGFGGFGGGAFRGGGATGSW